MTKKITDIDVAAGAAAVINTASRPSTAARELTQAEPVKVSRRKGGHMNFICDESLLNAADRLAAMLMISRTELITRLLKKCVKENEKALTEYEEKLKDIACSIKI